MCVLYVSFGSKVRPRTFMYVAMHSAVSGVNRVQVVLSGFSVRLFFCCTRTCVYRCDADVICVGYDLNLCSWWWYVCSVYVE